jgi:hypothetical protein
MTSNANGDGAICLSPQALRYNGRSLVIDASGVVTSTVDIQNPDYAAYVDNCQRYRIVSWGVRVYNILPGLTSQGTVRLITTNSIAGVGLDTTSNLFEEIQLEPVTGLDAYWTSSPTGTTWKEYIYDVDFASWTYLIVKLSGVPVSTACAQVEIIYNVEMVPQFGQIGATLATPAASANPSHLAAAGQVHAKKKHSHRSRPSLFSQISSFAKDALLDVASSYIPVIGQSMRRAIMPAPRRPMIMDVD